MNYIGFNKYDTANGPGIRVSLFVSGCTVHCKGCFNPESWDFNAGYKLTDEIKNEIISELKQPWIEGFSLLGGDPFEPQFTDCLCDLLARIKAEVGKSVWCWTGRKYEKVRHSPLMTYIDVLVDGQYEDELHDPTLKWRGSSNQRVIDVPKTLKDGKITTIE